MFFSIDTEPYPLPVYIKLIFLRKTIVVGTTQEQSPIFPPVIFQATIPKPSASRLEYLTVMKASSSVFGKNARSSKITIGIIKVDKRRT